VFHGGSPRRAARLLLTPLQVVSGRLRSPPKRELATVSRRQERNPPASSSKVSRGAFFRFPIGGCRAWLCFVAPFTSLSCQSVQLRVPRHQRRLLLVHVNLRSDHG